MLSFDAFFENLVRFGLEYFKRYYGIYRGIVTDNRDPLKRGRIYARVPGVGQQAAPEVWIYPAMEGAGQDRGSFWPPEIGDSVWVSFSNGDPSKPLVYWSGWYGESKGKGISDLPAEFAYQDDSPVRRGFVTRGGHRVVFSDAEGDERVEIAWHKPKASEPDKEKTPPREGDVGTTAFLKFTENGIELQVKDQKTKLIIEDGKLTIDAVDVLIATGADTPAVRGRELDTWLKSHTHGTAWGPSSPPLSPPPPSILSKNVKLK